MKILAKQRLLLAYDQEEVDDILDKYVINYNTSYLYDDEFLEDAKYYYSNKKPLRLFRGLLFYSESAYKNFVDSIKSGYITTDRATSWTKSKTIAEEFATHEKNLDNSVAMGLYISMKRDRKKYDKIDGYKGVVLITNIEPRQGIELKIGGEAEVLLPPGRYKVSRYEIQSYDEIVGDKTAEEVLKLAAKKDFINLLWYFQDRGLKPEDLSEDIKRKIFLYTYEPTNKKKDIRAELIAEPVYYKPYKNVENPYRSYIFRVYVKAAIESIPNFESLRWYDKSSQELILKNAKKDLIYLFNKVKKLVKLDLEEARNITKQARDKMTKRTYRKPIIYNVYDADGSPLYFAGVEWQFDIEYFVNKFDLEPEYRSVLRTIEKAYEASSVKDIFNRFSSGYQAARAYNMISTGQYMEKIMSIKEPSKRYLAIEQYNKDLANTVKGMAEYSGLNLL